MPETMILNIVTGAPGAGKSTAAEHCANAASGFVALDMDWLIDSASALAGQDIRAEPSLWPAYNTLWLDVLRSISRCGAQVVLFAPVSPPDLQEIPEWSADIRWLLLDCPDNVLRQRLFDRDWNEERIQDALDDAAGLRAEITKHVVDTHRLEPGEVATAVTHWLSSLPN